MELNKLIEIRDFHDNKAASYREDLPEINHGIAKKSEALKIYQDHDLDAFRSERHRTR